MLKKIRAFLTPWIGIPENIYKDKWFWISLGICALLTWGLIELNGLSLH